MKNRIIFIIFLFLQTFCFAVVVKTQYNYYTKENFANLIIDSENKDLSEYQIFVRYNSEIIQQKSLKIDDIQHIEIPIKQISTRKNELICQIISDTDTLSCSTKIIKLKPVANEVKVDRFHQSLIVDDLPFIPFGFYCYWPVQPTLPEEEVVKGFNMISPYQKIEKNTRKERRKYMDRCAELGLKVNYNLCSLGGGGGVGSARLKRSHNEIMNLLQDEVNEFKDHPALLSWYISDEPALNGVKPELLQETYNKIKEIDPYHPVSIVFMHSSKAAKYKDAMDIVMADPYPVPQHPVTQVQSVIKRLHEQFLMEKPIWIVPQAFGGNEWWPREPTYQEIRVMTYLAAIEQASGVQYFIRNGLNSFPKATYTWGECGKIAHEITELTPFLTEYDDVEKIETSSEKIFAKRWSQGKKELLLFVNTNNEPLEFTAKISEENDDLNLELPFENRSVKIEDGVLDSWIDGYDIRAYIINEEQKDSTFLHPKNVTLDPSFEFNPSVGVPSNCYAKIRADKGASYFIDSRVAYHGDHSIRLTCPTENNGVVLKFYRQRMQKNKTYTLSLWAKAIPEKRLIKKGFWNWLKRIFGKKEKWNTLKLHLHHVEKEFKLSNKWEKYSIQTEILAVNSKTYLSSPQIQMTGKGTCWIDGLQLIPDLEMEETLQLDEKHIEVELTSNHSNSKIEFSIDAGSSWSKYQNPINIVESTTLQVRNIKSNQEIGKLQKEIYFHKAVGADVQYQTNYTKKYNGGGKKGLVNAKFANKNYKNRNWQGFIAKDAKLDIDLGESKKIQKIRVGALHDIHSWVFLPQKIVIYSSDDGVNYTQIMEKINSLPMQNPDRFVKRFEIEFEPINTKHIRVWVDSLERCPDWHKGSGGACWLFLDEIEVE